MMTRGWRATDTLPLEPELAKTVSDTSFDEEGWTSMDDAMLDSWWVVHHVSFPQNVPCRSCKLSAKCSVKNAPGLVCTVSWVISLFPMLPCYLLSCYLVYRFTSVTLCEKIARRGIGNPFPSLSSRFVHPFPNWEPVHTLGKKRSGKREFW